MSGTTPNRSLANQWPKRPNEQMTSSAQSSTPYRSQIRLSSPQYPSGGTRAPPPFWTGSAITMDTVSGPSAKIISSMADTQVNSPAGVPAGEVHWRVLGTWRTPSQSMGRYGSRNFGMAVTASAPSVVPWYDQLREITLYLESSPLARW